MTDTVKPITPQEVGVHKTKVFPEYVFRAFNDCIAEKFVGGRATVKQKTVVARMIEIGFAAHGDPDDVESRNAFENQIYSRGYLNVEDAYRAAGWKVTYDKPAYYETYDASFEFKKSND